MTTTTAPAAQITEHAFTPWHSAPKRCATCGKVQARHATTLAVADNGTVLTGTVVATPPAAPKPKRKFTRRGPPGNPCSSCHKLCSLDDPEVDGDPDITVDEGGHVSISASLIRNSSCCGAENKRMDSLECEMDLVHDCPSAALVGVELDGDTVVPAGIELTYYPATYTVPEGGETLANLGRLLLGAAGWEGLVDSNPTVFTSMPNADDVVPGGTVLVHEDMGARQGLSYTVAEGGETLYDLAKALQGDGDSWPSLVETNDDVLAPEEGYDDPEVELEGYLGTKATDRHGKPIKYHRAMATLVGLSGSGHATCKACGEQVDFEVPEGELECQAGDMEAVQ